MPAYFSISIHQDTNKLTHDYVEKMYSAIIDAGYPFKGGYWEHEDADYDTIVKWNQSKLEQGFELGYTQHVVHDYMQILFDASEYSEMRGYWMHKKIYNVFKLIIPESDILIDYYDEGYDDEESQEDMMEPMAVLSTRIWEMGLADTIQTKLELDDGYHSNNEVLSGKNVSVRPFAIIPKTAFENFEKEFFENMELKNIGNEGVLINNYNNFPR